MAFSYIRTLGVFAVVAGAAITVYGQDQTGNLPTPAPAKVEAAPATPIMPGTPAPETPPGSEPIDKRILGVLTNYRTANMDAAATPMTVGGKMTTGGTYNRKNIGLFVIGNRIELVPPSPMTTGKLLFQIPAARLVVDSG